MHDKENMLGSAKLKEVGAYKSDTKSKKTLFIGKRHSMKKEQERSFQITFCNSHAHDLSS